KKLTLGNAGRSKGIGLDDVRTRLQKPAMDVANHLRLSQREEIAIVQNILLRILETLAANIGFRHVVRTNRRAHRPINNGDPALENLFKGMLACCSHSYLTSFRHRVVHFPRLFSYESHS